MSHSSPVMERREASRICIDLPVTVQDGSNFHKTGKVIDLSTKGAAILYSELPEIDSKLGLRFKIPTENISPEIRVGVRVKHIYEISHTPGMPPECQYVVGVEFLDMDPQAQTLLAEFLR